MFRGLGGLSALTNAAALYGMPQAGILSTLLIFKEQNDLSLINTCNRQAQINFEFSVLLKKSLIVLLLFLNLRNAFAYATIS